MASQELKNYVQEVANAVNSLKDKKKSIELEVIDALYQASHLAMFTENDVKYSLALSNQAKKFLSERIYTETKGQYGLWSLENLSANMGRPFPEIDLFYEILKQESFYNLQSFIYYMERKRKSDKRFYYPRRNTLNSVLNDLTEFENGKFHFYGLSMPPRTGKLIADYTPVLTKGGWKTHGELTTNDYVLGRNMEWVKVLQVHPKNVANRRVWFSDGTFIDCHENHEWVVFDRSRNSETIKETKELVNSEYACGTKRRYRYQLPLSNETSDNADIDLPMNPYVLGAWLGDGTNTKPYLTICDTDIVIVDEVVKAGYNQLAIFSQVGCKVYSFGGLRHDLKQFGMCHRSETRQKHIPDVYFTASKRQRLELLAGLIDTDGCLRLKEHRYDFSTSDERLRDDVIKLISTFGWRVCVVANEPCLSSGGIQGKKTNYRITFNPTFEIPCRVARKQLKEFSKPRRIAITHIENIEPTSGNCITVEGGVYRVGERLKLTHNSTLCIFFLNWVMMKRPNSHNAMCGHSGVLSKGFFKETCNFITSEEYCFRELYEYWHPDATLVQNKSAEDCTITLDKPDRFATLTCRGIDGTWTGAVDISNDGYLYVDDLVRDREESMSMQRMENLYQTYQNTVLDRKNAESRELQVGTLWSINDPLERTRVLFEDDEDYRFRRIPALDEHDHSNFNYELNGFPDKYYINLRKRLDKAEWEAKYQQRPFVREGLLFPTEELRYFNGVIEDDARESTTVAVIDPAFGGGDSLSMPICRDYGHKERYIIDWVFDTGTQNKTVPKIVSKIIQHYITRLRIERNSGGQLLADSIKQEMARQGCFHCKIELVGAPVKMSKEDKISAYSDFVKDNFIFLLPNIHVNKGIFAYRRSVEYQRAMDEMCMFSAQGKQPHDDAPDSITQLAIMFDQKSNGSVDVVKNPFKY